MMLLGRPRQAALVLYREDGGATPDDPSLARGVPKVAPGDEEVFEAQV